MNQEKPAYKPNVLDRTIAFFSPGAALRREQARYGLDYIMGARRFDGASKTSRFEQWKRPGTSANSALAGSLPLLRNSSRDLTRNNPWVENAQRVIVNNTVGAGITGQIHQSGGQKNENRIKMLQSKWWDWAHTTECDADGRLDLAGLQALAMNTIVESGEVLIRRRYRRSTAQWTTIPIQLQILEPDYLDNSRDGVLQNGEIVNGIEYNSQGQIVAYWLYENHPGDSTGFGRSFKSNRIRASEIIHAFDPKRCGQGRGYPWVASAIRRLKDFDDYEDAQLVRQKIAACFAGFVQDMAPPSGATGLERSGPTAAQKDFMQPGMMEHLPPGKTITFPTPPAVQNYGEYSRAALLGAAACFGITYEALTNDYSGVNYSSGRMGWLEMNRNITRWQNMVMRVQILERVGAWFFGGLTLAGEDSRGVYMKWIPPKREMMDPTKEVPAAIKEIRGGLTSRSRYLASRGLDVEEINAEIAADNAALDKDSIILDSDPRKVNTAGS